MQANDQVVRRNREDLRPRVDTATPTSVVDETVRELDQPASNAQATTQPASNTQATPQQTPARRTSLRTVKLPARFKDYV